MEADDEIQVFDKLNLVYKQPYERDCFDAVIPKFNETIDFEIADHEKKLEATYSWVK
jgi:hypothetical protein